MKSIIITDSIKYDGSQILPLWAYGLGIKGDSLVIFHGPMDVTRDNIKDLEDSKAGKTIMGDDLIHIIIERFETPASMRTAYYMQRLLIADIKDVFENHGIKTIRNGDDLFAGTGKLTVSIATAGVTSEKIHCGINITTRGTPSDVSTASLHDLGINDWMALAREIADAFIKEIEDIEEDIVKTKSL